MATNYDHDLEGGDTVLDVEHDTIMAVDSVDDDGNVVWEEGWEQTGLSVDNCFERGEYEKQ